MRFFIFFLVLFLTPMEGKKGGQEKPRLSSIQIIDRNGFSENITLKEKLEAFENVNFLSHQPYKRVLRVYSPLQDGTIFSFLTTYYENGQIKQHLEIKNARALGLYQEWHQNGKLKAKTRIVGGPPDLTPEAQRQWVFDGLALAYDEEGGLIGKIPYKKGLMDGLAETFWSADKPLSKTPFKNGLIDGDELIYSKSGKFSERHHYTDGILDGPSWTYWDDGKIATIEEYKKGLLIYGVSFSRDGNIVHFVHEGEGVRNYHVLGKLNQEQEIHEGVIRGKVTNFGDNEKAVSTLQVRDGGRHGLETILYPNGKPKMTIDWVEGKIKGKVISWYSNGVKESEREVVNNKKQGLSLAWYPTGDFLLIESYDSDKLDKGEYFKKGEKNPVSSVSSGSGIATLFDKDGLLKQKVTYENGKPVSE